MRRCASAAVCGLVVWSTALVALARPAAGAPTPPPPRPEPARAHPTLNPALPKGTRLLVVRTVPAVVGAAFRFASTPFATTDESGVASLLIASSEREEVAADRNDVLVVATPTLDVARGVRAVFTGWSGSGTYVDGVMTEIATFRTDYLTQLRFVNRHGREVTPSRVTSVELTNTSGAAIESRGGRPVWLTGREATAGSDGMTTKTVAYSVAKVVVAGSNVVNSGQQRFVPTSAEPPPVRLLLFTVRFVARDALFPSHTGTHVHLRRPDGSVTDVALQSGSAVLHDVPRGDYDASIDGGTLHVSRPLSISRDQTVEIDAVSYVDVVVLAAALVLVAAAVLLVGRRLRHARRDPAWTGKPEPGRS